MSKFSASRARSPFFVKILCGLRSKKPYFFFIKILCGRRSLSLFVKILCGSRSKKASLFFVKILCVPRPLSFFSSKSVRTLRRRAEALPARQSRHITARLFHKEFSVPVIPLCGRDSRRALIGVFARQKTLCPQHSTENTAPDAEKSLCRSPPSKRRHAGAAEFCPRSGRRDRAGRGAEVQDLAKRRAETAFFFALCIDNRAEICYTVSVTNSL